MGRQESYEDMDRPLFIREQPSQVIKEQFHTVNHSVHDQTDFASDKPSLYITMLLPKNAKLDITQETRQKVLITCLKIHVTSILIC